MASSARSGRQMVNFRGKRVHMSKTRRGTGRKNETELSVLGERCAPSAGIAGVKEHVEA